MSHNLQRGIEIGLSVLGVLAIIWFYYSAVKRSDDRSGLIFKTVLSLVFIGGTVLFIHLMNGKVAGGVVSASAPATLIAGSVAACGFLLSILWTPHISDFVIGPLTGLYDGGRQEVEKRPFYSIARAKQKRGKYEEAITIIRTQLARFPNDFEGQMLIAEIQAEGQNDMAAAEATVQRLCNQKGHSANQMIYALNAMADWYLKYGQDVDAARTKLERIVELFPGSEFALAATQRIAHLADTHRVIMARHDHRKIDVPEGVANMGLLEAGQHAKPNEVPPEQQAADYVKHLEQHPLDMDAREKLAALYANHYQRLDLATDQLEQMIKTPGQPARNMVRWLNLLADFQIKLSGNFETVKVTLERIIEIAPDKASANLAQTRIGYLKLQLKGVHETKQSVKLGTYEKDIGLKG